MEIYYRTLRQSLSIMIILCVLKLLISVPRLLQRNFLAMYLILKEVGAPFLMVCVLFNRLKQEASLERRKHLHITRFKPPDKYSWHKSKMQCVKSVLSTWRVLFGYHWVPLMDLTRLQ